jgi:hypothetical protein
LEGKITISFLRVGKYHVTNGIVEKKRIWRNDENV